MLGMVADPNSNGAQTLLIDADDTLWENNIYFERAIANFISFLNHHEYTPEQVREVLNQVERESIVSHGYGLHSFAHSLIQTFEKLAVEPLTPALHETINGFAHKIAGHPVELLPDVAETLQYLSERHHLILMTKGAVPEQSGQGRTLRPERVFCRDRDRVGKECPYLPLESFPSTNCFPTLPG
jgi:putative hydrolase of the HAD superfamily